MKPYPIPAKEARVSIEIQKSRFIATIAPAFSVEQARAFIARIRAEFPDANHHVPVFLIGKEPSLIEHCSDDGEPSGTAGRPALAVLKGSGLGDAVAVVTRYFGGIKLGTGGLVRAYSDAIRAVLTGLTLAQRIPTYLVSFTIGYPLYERVRLAVEKTGGRVETEEFAGEVTINARFPVEAFELFRQELQSLTNGGIQAEILETNPDSIFPYDNPSR